MVRQWLTLNATLEQPQTRKPIDRRVLTRMVLRNRIWQKIGYIPHAKQKVVHNAILLGAKRIINIWGRRSGKSIMVASEIATEMGYKSESMLPHRLIRIMAPESDITEKIFNYVYRWVVDKKVFGCAPKFASAPKHYIEMPWGARVEGLTTDKPESLLGDGIVLNASDEHAENKRDPDRLVSQYIMPPLMDTGGIAWFITTSCGRHNHAEVTFDEWYKLMLAGDRRYFASRMSSYENTAVPDYEAFRADLDAEAARCERLGMKSLFDQLYHSIPAALSGAVYPEFNREKHVFTDMQPLPGIPITMGIDWGYKNPFVCLFGQVLNDGERFRVFDEIYQSGLTDQDAADQVNAKRDKWGLPIAEAFPDPSAPEAINTFTTAGIPMWSGSSKMNQRLNAIIDGILQVRGTIASDNLLVSSRCINLIRELEGYVYSDRSQDEKPVKGDDHACDALRYLVRGAKITTGNVEALWV